MEAPAGVIVVSPTYCGMAADVPALVDVAHAHDVPIVVDEAWGSHLAFHEDLPVDAISAGADLVISSTHKKLGSLTQSAMLHLGRSQNISRSWTTRRAVTRSPTGRRSSTSAGALSRGRALNSNANYARRSAQAPRGRA